MIRTPLPSLAAFVVLVIAASGSAGSPPVELVSSSEAGIVVRCHPGDVSIAEAWAGDCAYSVVTIPGTGRLGIEGAPELPVVRAVLAVPDCERVDVRVTAEGTVTHEGIRVLPSPTTVPAGEDQISDYRYLERDAYSAGGLWPPAAAHVSEPVWFGTQRVVVVEFYPCQTDPAAGILVSHDDIVVEVGFRGIRDRVPLRNDSARRERLYRAVLLNYESGRAWRARPGRGDGRPAGEYFSTSDNWAKLTLRDEGVYRIGYSDLQSADIDPAAIDPTTIRIFWGGGLPVPSAVTEPRPDWMDECTILVLGEDDGSFDPDDAIIFYGMGVDGWADELGVEDPDEPYFENPFTNCDVYWLTWESPGSTSGFSEAPRRMEEDDLQSSPTPFTVNNYRVRSHFESNVYEREGRGDNWFWHEMDRTGLPETRYFHEMLDHVLTDSTGVLRASVLGSSNDYQVNPDHYALFYLNDAEAYVGSWDGYQELRFETPGLPMREGYNTYEVYVPREDPDHANDYILIDWFELIYWRELWADSGAIRFGSSGRTGTIEYSIGGFAADEDVLVLKLVDKYTQRIVPGVSEAGGRVVFQDEVADSTSYVAVSTSGFLVPTVERDWYGNLRTPTDADYIMITYDGFYDEALRLKSHRESAAGGGFRVRLVKVSDVYDEFSWGLVDPTAIRDYLKYTFENAEIPPTHVLLIGDASSDYRQYLLSSIPTYFPAAYAGGAAHWPTESWFVGFSSTTYYEPAMALGRLPAKSSAELTTMIDKIVRYETEAELGPWKNTAIVIADDEFKTWGTGNPDEWDCCEYFHTVQAESLAERILPLPLDRKKVYLMEYDHDLAGHMPAAREDILEEWNEGALIVNYTGHGNELLMAHEYVFLFDDVARLTNINGLPIYFAASCRLNKFDQPNIDSLGEALVKSPTGGAIASIGSTRDSNATPNSELDAAFFWYLFGQQRELPTAFMDVGTAFQAAFVDGWSNWVNNTKFSLMGDPALVLAAPAAGGAFSTEGLEPMRRKDLVELEAQTSGAAEGLDGVALIVVSDNADTTGYTHTYPPPERHVHYRLPGEPLYRGWVPVADGALSAEFVVSAFAEEGQYGRIRAYAYGRDVDASFSVEDVAIADSVQTSDVTPPTISLEFEGGGTSVLPGARLTVAIDDDHGVNLVDRRTADGIVLRIDGGADTTNLTDEFAYDLGSYQSGSLAYNLPSLVEGGHAVEVTVTDNMGNAATEHLSFEIVSAADFKIRDVANYPNPFPGGRDGGTYILFQLSTEADVEIDVFTVGGRLVRVLDGIVGEAGANQVYWDGRDQEGDELANGVYLYRIEAVSRLYRGDRAEVIGRAVVMR